MKRINQMTMDVISPVRRLPFNRFFDWHGFHMDDDNPIKVQYIVFRNPRESQHHDERQVMLSKLLTDTHGIEPAVLLFAKLSLGKPTPIAVRVGRCCVRWD